MRRRDMLMLPTTQMSFMPGFRCFMKRHYFRHAAAIDDHHARLSLPFRLLFATRDTADMAYGMIADALVPLR